MHLTPSRVKRILNIHHSGFISHKCVCEYSRAKSLAFAKFASSTTVDNLIVAYS
ncbi:MAG: hypothetical protein Rpha_1144 [Candidatus Ruthia sp. Apha_13_S6]|nr:hypothetical protein [Candidatus Ruthia sp. Apha_13_S6]